MKGRFTLIPFVLAAISASLFTCGSAAVRNDSQGVRQPAVAGAFYPADPKELAAMVDGFLRDASPQQISEPIVALVSPHAGYEYSGHVAAHAYALLRGRKTSRVVVIAPCHIEAFPFISVYNGTAYATPLGVIPVDEEFSKKLAGMSPLIRLSERGHGIVQGRGEHALEDQLPFLQRVLGDFKLVPIVMGDQNYELSRTLGISLAKLAKGTDTLIVASSDLSHYHPYDEAVSLDHKVLSALEEWDYFNMMENFERRVWEACGGGPIVAAMIAAERLGANRARVMKYANSGDLPGGDRSRVVGYGAAVLTIEKAKPKAEARQFSLSGEEKEELMTIARKSVDTAVKERKLFECSAGGHEALARDRGAFVTLKEKGQLRGCIGYIAPTKPLCLTVRDVAALAALKDSRFPPVSAAELGQLEYEISVLSPLRRVSDIKEIKIGRDGLVIWKGDAEGILLPQVPTEFGWDRKTFLEQICAKAGLPTNAWQDEGADLFTFSALVFGENTPEPIIPTQPGLGRDESRSPRRPGQDSLRP
jgi:AmmeMemoRadiSam system protein B/AmmeMemoRadiSam system protein A